MPTPTGAPVRSIFSAPDGTVYAMVSGEGVYRINSDNGSMTKIADIPKTKYRWYGTACPELNLLCVAVRAVGLYLINTATGEVKFLNREKVGEDFSSNGITSLYIDSRQRL